MRKIHVARRRDNRRRRTGAAGALLIALLAVAGCGGGGDQAATADRPAPGSTHVGSACALVITDHGLRQFYDLADRVAAGEQVSVEAMGQVAAQPVWDRWRRSFEPDVVPAAPIGRALFLTFRTEDELPERLRDKPIRVDLLRNYLAAVELRPRIESFVEDITADDGVCAALDLLAGWVSDGDLPDTLRLDFMVGHPEIRYYEDHIMLDAGLAWACGRGQLARSIASVVYRHVAAVEGIAPDQAHGPDILLESLRLVRNEGIPGYIDDMASITFDPRHPLLQGASPRVDDTCLAAQRSLASLDGALTHLRAMPDAGDGHWIQTMRIFVGAQSWQASGWYMARVIAMQSGEERLQEASRTVADFFAAYQEAARTLPAQPDAQRGTVAWFLQGAPSFTDDNAAWLDEQLRRRFP